jgi:hypothetical protein
VKINAFAQHPQRLQAVDPVAAAVVPAEDLAALVQALALVPAQVRLALVLALVAIDLNFIHNLIAIFEIKKTT